MTLYLRPSARKRIARENRRATINTIAQATISIALVYIAALLFIIAFAPDPSRECLPPPRAATGIPQACVDGYKCYND